MLNAKARAALAKAQEAFAAVQVKLGTPESAGESSYRGMHPADNAFPREMAPIHNLERSLLVKESEDLATIIALIKRGLYGICQGPNCKLPKKRIPKARMEAVLTATRCIDCQSELE